MLVTLTFSMNLAKKTFLLALGQHVTCKDFTKTKFALFHGGHITVLNLTWTQIDTEGNLIICFLQKRNTGFKKHCVFAPPALNTNSTLARSRSL